MNRSWYSIFTLCVVGQVKELLSWAKKARPLAKMGLVLASIALRVFTGVAIPTTEIESAFGTKAGGAMSEFVKEGLTSGVEAMASVAGERLEDQPVIEVKHFFVLPICCVRDCRKSSEYTVL